MASRDRYRMEKSLGKNGDEVAKTKIPFIQSVKNILKYYTRRTPDSLVTLGRKEEEARKKEGKKIWTMEEIK